MESWTWIDEPGARGEVDVRAVEVDIALLRAVAFVTVVGWVCAEATGWNVLGVVPWSLVAGSVGYQAIWWVLLWLSRYWCACGLIMLGPIVLLGCLAVWSIWYGIVMVQFACGVGCIHTHIVISCCLYHFVCVGISCLLWYLFKSYRCALNGIKLDGSTVCFFRKSVCCTWDVRLTAACIVSLNVCTCLYLSNVVSLFVGLYHCVYVCVSW